jgi:hypothetical protein
MEGPHASVVCSGFRRILLGLFCSGALVLASTTIGMAQESKTPAITQLELQGDLMGFADRLASFLGQVNFDPAFRAQPVLLRDVTFTIMAAFTSAAEPYPGISLLDMVVLTTLTRLIYEEHWQRQFGQLVQPALAAFRALEADIWTIAAKVLTPEEQRDLRALISAWHRVHPQQVFVSSIRFGDFTQESLAFSLAEAKKARGLFKSVQEVAQKVDRDLGLRGGESAG